MPRRDGTPVWIADQAGATILKSVPLHSGAGSSFSEKWLQSLLFDCPTIFPARQIEDNFGTLVPICLELPLDLGGGHSGYLDNLFLTGEGQIVLVETKLWRNPEARRTVVAQVMDYAAAVFRMIYEVLDAAVIKARKAMKQPVESLFALMKGGNTTLDEPDFIDAVTRNLRLGRAIAAVVGDGIHEELTAISHLLQSHAGHRFTFALVEMVVFETPETGVRLVLPSVLAQTVLIERGVIYVQDNPSAAFTVEVKSPALLANGVAISRPHSLSEEEFYDILDLKHPGISEPVKSFIAKAASLGIYTEIQGGLNLKHTAPDGPPLNLGTIDKYGTVDTQPASLWNRYEYGCQYGEALAGLIGGQLYISKTGQECGLRIAPGKMARVWDLLPGHEQAWLDAMERYIDQNLANARFGAEA